MAWCQYSGSITDSSFPIRFVSTLDVQLETNKVCTLDRSPIGATTMVVSSKYVLGLLGTIMSYTDPHTRKERKYHCIRNSNGRLLSPSTPSATLPVNNTPRRSPSKHEEVWYHPVSQALHHQYRFTCSPAGSPIVHTLPSSSSTSTPLSQA